MSNIVQEHRVTVQEPAIAEALFSDTRFAIIWLIIRLYTGYQWVMAGYEKLTSPAWTGSQAGTAMGGFVQGALKLTAGDHPSVAGWYAWFLTNLVLPYTAVWSWLITLGELAVGIGLILGLLTGVAAFFGGLMNANYLLSGTVSTNPLLFIFATWLVLGWRVAGYYGVDRWLLPILGVPGHPGSAFRHQVAKPQRTNAAA
jgi:thiosulfate dehydrogenase [quinone] large subunit